MRKLSVIIPTRNEEGNIQSLILQINEALTKNNITYEIVFVDDHSTDGTQDIIRMLSRFYPISLFEKKAKVGKAYSLLEGFTYAKYDIICMIDADLQYPPQAIPEMVQKLNHADVVVANRKEQKISLTRKILSETQLFLFNNILHGIHWDVQSGLKVFKKELIERFTITPTQWTFDLEFLLKAKDAGYCIDTVDITFSKRYAGESKVHVLQTGWEIAKSSLKLKFRKRDIIPLHPLESFKRGKGFHYKGNLYVHHSGLHISETAFFRLTHSQEVAIGVVILFFFISLLVNWHATLVTLLGILTFFYFCDLLFNLFLISRNFYQSPEIEIRDHLLTIRDNWPSYTIFCPLYKEASVLPQFISAMKSLNYPKDKLQVMLLLEEDDTETIQKAQTSQLPFYFEVIIVPHSMPKTKPKALNYGLSQTKGDYVVIYDAEDIPDPLQLKKVVLAFDKAPEDVACIQAKLNFYNPKQNLLTRIFTAEYSLWFDLVLTGLQSITAPIPLGGTSNHFKIKDIMRLRGWDSFNVTEDCDLGIRLARDGYKTAIVNSTTYEEANSNVKNWFHQRGRWIKGYIQTFFVHNRDPRDFIKKVSWQHFAAFQLIVGGRILSLFINPLLWAITISYFAFRASLGAFIESFFPGPIFYVGILSLVFGNFLYIYYYMIATIKREHYGLTKFAFLVPFYWLGMSYSAWNALYTMIVEPYHWAKTIHGFHLQTHTPETEKPEEKLPLTYHPTPTISGAI